MKIIPEQEILTCIYCHAKQEYPAIDYIPFIPNLSGTAKPAHNTSAQEERCCECDSVMYLKLNDDKTISIANSSRI